MSEINRVIYFVVGDKGLNSGNGEYVPDLEEMKKRLLKMTPEGEWQLVISMHGAEDVLATVGGYLRTRPDKGVYDAEDIRKLFVDDEHFKKWREAYGSTWVTLNSCQVNQKFEAVIIQAFNKPKAAQKAQGLGKGCRPYTEIQSYGDSSGKEVATRQHYIRLPKNEKKQMLEMLSELNEKFGYFGGRPVPATHILDYYFDEEPKGAWPVVTVSLNRVDTGISFYNRTQNTRFLRKCERHMGRCAPMCQECRT